MSSDSSTSFTLITAPVVLSTTRSARTSSSSRTSSFSDSTISLIVVTSLDSSANSFNISAITSMPSTSSLENSGCWILEDSSLSIILSISESTASFCSPSLIILSISKSIISSVLYIFSSSHNLVVLYRISSLHI